jgi:DNA-directed RNA polymerase subunit RPC12/RpoP
MKKEITIPEQMHKLRPDEFEAAARRREDYSLARNKQAQDFNNAILSRLEKEKEMVKLNGQKTETAEIAAVSDEKIIKCEKCGAEFTAVETKGKVSCPECNRTIKLSKSGKN